MNKLDEVFCPGCERLIDAATGVTTDNAPKENDLSMCFYCGTYLEFKLIDDSLIPMSFSHENLLKLPKDVREQLIDMKLTWALSRAER